MKIINIIGKEILNSQGHKTIECEICLEDGSVVNASVPSGTSKSKFEAHELIDDNGSVENACDAINNIIAPQFLGKVPNAIEMDIQMLQLDGTSNKSKLGANSILAVSMAMYRAHALVTEMELFDFIAMVSGLETVSLPIPIINFINGGMHADNNLFIQEYLVIPYGSKNIKSSIQNSILLFNSLKEVLKKSGKSTCLGIEGGYSANFENETEPLDFILKAIKKVNLEPDTFSLGIDVAASQFYNEKTQLYNCGGTKKTDDEMIEWYKKLTDDYNLFSIEDALSQDSWQGWIKLMNVLSDKLHVVGDDLLATNPERIAKGIEFGAINTVIIKPNQIGTITETLQAIGLCKEYGLSTIVSHRSQETNDPFIIDLAVGSSATYVKCGGLNHGERISKYNRLLEIENELIGLVLPD